MTTPIVADTGPLIGLARSTDLDLLRHLYKNVLIPEAVHAELQIGSSRPGALALAQALKSGWICPILLKSELFSLRDDLCFRLGTGEAEAICLAEQEDNRFLLIDDRAGRMLAKQRGINVVGTGAVLLAAKRKGQLTSVIDALKRLSNVGYRLSPALIEKLVKMAGESLEER